MAQYSGIRDTQGALTFVLITGVKYKSTFYHTTFHEGSCVTVHSKHRRTVNKKSRKGFHQKTSHIIRESSPPGSSHTSLDNTHMKNKIYKDSFIRWFYRNVSFTDYCLEALVISSNVRFYCWACART